MEKVFDYLLCIKNSHSQAVLREMLKKEANSWLRENEFVVFRPPPSSLLPLPYHYPPLSLLPPPSSLFFPPGSIRSWNEG
jgi:hypothetical protein